MGSSAAKYGPVQVPAAYRMARERLLKDQHGQRVSYGDIARATGLNVGHVCRIFTRKRQPSLETVRRISAYLGCSIEKLLSVLES